jgi:beta-glucosidase
VRPPRENPATTPFLSSTFQEKHERNLARIKEGNIDLLFMGDSITDFWRNEGAVGVANPPRAGARVFAEYFGGMNTANFGISGDTTQGVLYRLRHGEGTGFQPKAIMLMIGTNNTTSCSAPEIAEGIGAIVLELRNDFPSAKLLLLGIFPRGDSGDPARPMIVEINRRIAALADGKAVFYRDIGHGFLRADGVIPKDIMQDRLHPTEKGYRIWAEAIKDQIAELLR